VLPSILSIVPDNFLNSLSSKPNAIDDIPCSSWISLNTCKCDLPAISVKRIIPVAKAAVTSAKALISILAILTTPVIRFIINDIVENDFFIKSLTPTALPISRHKSSIDCAKVVACPSTVSI